MINQEYFTRQTGIINPEQLNKSIGIVGAGSIGSWTALALLKLGCQKVKVYDFDNVEAGNVGSQIYTSADIGKLKLEALQEKLNFLTGETIETESVRITKENMPDSLLQNDIIILAVDNIETRALIFDAIPHDWQGVLIDARMAGNALEIYPLDYTKGTEAVLNYAKTLFPPEKAIPVLCSMRSVVYNVFIVAGLITDLIAKIAKGEALPPELVADLENLTLYGSND